jgi:hypothetical protein
MDESAVRDGLVRHWRFAGIDDDEAREIYHDDAVLELPNRASGL